MTNLNKIQVLSTNGNKISSEIFNVSTRTISEWRKQLKIPSPTPTGGKRIFAVNETFFSNIDTEQKAYSLGFISADGNVTFPKYSAYLKICLHRRDRDILEKINLSMDSTYLVKDTLLGRNSGYSGSCKLQSTLSICSIPICEDLGKLGVVPNKTAIIQMPPLPKNIQRHYLRGYLDGDGYITKGDFGITSNLRMLTSIQQCLSDNSFEYPSIDYANNYPRLRFSPKYHEILKWIYEDSSIYLNRKHEKYNEFWKNRIYKKPNRLYYPRASEKLPSGLDSSLVVEPSSHS